jgi:hypothetical protein
LGLSHFRQNRESVVLAHGDYRARLSATILVMPKAVGLCFRAGLWADYSPDAVCIVRLFG